MADIPTVYIADYIFTSSGNGDFRRGDRLRQSVTYSPGALIIHGDIILDVGDPDPVLKKYPSARILEFPGSSIVPGLVDPHTHPLFGGNRLEEMILKTRGTSYLEIQARGGGITSTTMATRKTGDRIMLDRAKKVISRMVRNGVTSLEAKSGYGLSLEEELRQLRLLSRLKKELSLDISITCLGAHSIPPEYRDKREEFIKMVTEELFPRAVKEGLCEYADVFCDEDAFTLSESREILSAAARLGLKLKIHAEEFKYLGGAVMAAEMGATSADHLLKIPDQDIEKFARTRTVAVLLPLTALFLGGKEYPPARKLIDKSAIVALGSDFNAGSCFSESLPAAMSLASLVMKMEPEEVIQASTINAAYACGLEKKVGSLEAGKQADFLILEIEDPREWPYHPGTNLIQKVFKKGSLIWEQVGPEINKVR